MHTSNKTEKTLICAEDIKKRVAEMGAQITRDFAKKRPLVVGILKGAWIFMADLLREIDIDVDVDFMSVSSYGGGTKSQGYVKLLKDMTCDCKDRDVLIVEDIIDSGITLSKIKELLLSRNAKSVTIAALLSKPSRRKADVEVKYVGFEIPDEFVVGYGMDFGEGLRTLCDVRVLKREEYE